MRFVWNDRAGTFSDLGENPQSGPKQTLIRSLSPIAILFWWRGIVSFTHLAREGRMTVTIGRRDLLAALGGTAAAWPLAARAQQSAKKMLRVGTVSGTQKSSPQWAAFLRRLAELGYQEGKTFTFDLVPTANEAEYETGYRTLAARELDIVLATGPEIALKSALAATRTLPIVMIAIDYDPFARGYVTSLARPSGM